jgi:hypothetical protein
LTCWYSVRSKVCKFTITFLVLLDQRLRPCGRLSRF